MLTYNFWSQLESALKYGKTYVDWYAMLPDGTGMKFDAGGMTSATAARNLLAAPLECIVGTPSSGSTTSSSAGWGGVSFGSGTTPPSREDFCLQAPVTGITVVCPTEPLSNATDEYVEYTYTYAVTASVDVTIAEIGVFAKVLEYNSRYYNLLQERTLLDEPVTIKAGETKSIQYTIRFGW